MKKTLSSTILIAIVAILSLIVSATTYTHALNDPGGGGGSGDNTEITDAVIKKNILYYTLNQCYTDSDSLNTNISFVGKTYTSVFTTDAQIFKGDKKVNIPNGFYDKEKNIACRYNYSAISGTTQGIMNKLASEATNKSKLTVNASDPKSRTAYYEGMGYTSSSAGEEEAGTVDDVQCLYMTYTYNGNSGSTNGICFTLSGNKMVSMKNDPDKLKSVSGAELTLNGAFDGSYYGSSTSCTNPASAFCYGAGTQKGYVSITVHADGYQPDKYRDASGYTHYTVLDGINKDEDFSVVRDSFSMMTDDIANSFISSGVVNDTFKNLTGSSYKMDSGGGSSGSKADMDTYTISNGTSGYRSAYSYLEGDGGSSQNSAFDTTEKYYIYMNYLKNIYGLTIGYEECEDTDQGDKYLPVVVLDESNKKVWKYCLISNYTDLDNSNERHKVNTGDSWKEENVEFMTIVGYIKGLSGMNINRLPANQLSATVLPTDPGEDPGTEEQAKEPTCYDNAGSLGWVLCPIIDSLSKFILKLYVDWIEPSLVINAKLFDTTQNTGTYDAWCVFRDIANVLFVILFIFVIFSQLTGVGIDNYGIKKILPKLIVGAILINMSYIICQAVIDIANIVGHGIGSLFQSLSNQIGTVDSVTIGTETVGPDSWGSSFLSSAWNPIIVVVVAAFAAYTVLSQGLAIIIPALMLMISVAAAIFGLIAILGIRQALSVILVVFSPLAFACYMLPNTKPIFDKWYGGLKGVLIAYPICSAMIYGGDMVGNILMHAAGPGDTWLMISAAVISIAPVFFIPKVISASMGALSRGIMRVSGGIGNWGRGKLGRSGFAMDMQRRAQMQKAGIKFDKNGNAKYTRWGKIQNKTALTRGSKQRLDMQRRQAALGNAQMGQAGTFMGAAGLTRMTNMNLSAQAGQEEQDVRDTQTSIGLGKGESYIFGEDGKAEAVYDKNGKFVDYKKEKVNASSIDSLQQGLRTALVTGNTTDIKAYQNMLAAKGDAGRQAIANAMTQAQASSAGNQKLTNAAVQAFSQNIMDNYAKDFKENARSTYNFANANQSINADNEGFSGPAMGSAEYMTKGSSLKSTQIGSMDDSELDSIAENIKTLQNNIDNGSLVGDDLEAAKAEINAARAAASGALSDSSIRGSIKQGNIDKLIEINGGVDPVVEQQEAQAEVAAAAQKTQDEQLAAINSINDQLKKRNSPPEPHIIITGHNRHLGDVGGKSNNNGASA